MKSIKRYAIFALVLMMAVQLPICAADVSDASIVKKVSEIATDLGELAVMAANGLLLCGQTALDITHVLTSFTKKHPVIACTMGLSAYAAWRVMKYKYGDRIYCTLRGVPPHAYYYCPSCGHIGDASYNILH